MGDSQRTKRPSRSGTAKSRAGRNSGNAGKPDAGKAQPEDRPARGRGGTRRAGRRRAVGPLIGEQLAEQLLDEHQPDVLLSEQCTCGMPYPCPSRVFATNFVDDQPPATLEQALERGLVSRVTAPPEPSRAEGASPEPRHAVEETAAEQPAAGDGAAPLDPDATQQIPKITGESAPVAVAV